MLLSILLTAGAIIGLTWAAAARHDVRREAARTTASATPATAPVLGMLRHWDRRRAEAWSQADAGALASLYVRGSAAGVRDLAMLAAYRRRGLRVTGVHEQVFAVETVRRSPDHLVLLVTDRLVDAVARGGGVGLALPHDAWSTRRITWRRVDGRWLVDRVRDV